MKKWILFILVIIHLVVLSSAGNATELDAADNPFVFRDSVTWGMSPEDILAIEGEPDSRNAITPNAEVFLYTGKRVSKYPAVLIYYFSDNALMMAMYSPGIEEQDNMDYLLQAYSAKYGECTARAKEDYAEFFEQLGADLNAVAEYDEAAFYEWTASQNTKIVGIFLDREKDSNGSDADTEDEEASAEAAQAIQSRYHIEIYYISPYFGDTAESGVIDLSGV